MTESSRQGWPSYFMAIAHVVAARGTCNRKQVGCVIAREHRIVTTGYNGSIPGLPHCDDVGHDLVETLGEDGVLRANCVRTIHAEMNAIAVAARYGIALEGATAYINTFPCWPCFRALASVGIKTVWFDDEYREDPRVREAARMTGLLVMKFTRDA